MLLSSQPTSLSFWKVASFVNPLLSKQVCRKSNYFWKRLKKKKKSTLKRKKNTRYQKSSSLQNKSRVSRGLTTPTTAVSHACTVQSTDDFTKQVESFILGSERHHAEKKIRVLAWRQTVCLTSVFMLCLAKTEWSCLRRWSGRDTYTREITRKGGLTKKSFWENVTLVRSVSLFG